MRGDVKNIHVPFDGMDKKLVIPVYQRNYDWSRKQCERLFNDIEEVARTHRESHFFGSVVGKPEDSFTWVVIDGQQRLTTVSLLILALVHAVRDGEVEEPTPGLTTKLMNNYLLVNGTDEQKFKLKPIKDDSDSYSRLFGSPEFFNEKSNLTANYSYFRERLRATDLNADQLWNDGISRLEVMHLDLEPKDDPQRIFETLNSTGLALKESDKIRNLVLMGLDHREQTRVYEKFWNPMEKNVDFRTDTFIRWYLTAQTSKTPNEADVFEAFKSFAAKSSIPTSDIVEDMHLFSTYDRALRTADTKILEVDKRLRTANLIFGDVVKPFLWLTFRDVKEGVITAADFTRVIQILETYIFRRIVVAAPSNSLNKIFANAYSELKKLRRHDETYSEILTYMLRGRAQSGWFPDDEAFLHAFRTRNFYGMKSSYRPYLFQMLERGNSRDVVDIASFISNEELTVEHIMPQTLSNAWRADLGPDAEDIHREWVNRIANLTITGYNSKYSNSSFKTKKEMEGGFLQSPFEINAYIKSQSSWGLTQLEQRADLLNQLALQRWPMPTTTFTPDHDILRAEPLGEESNFTGEEISAVEVNGAKTAVQSWADATEIVLRALIEVNREGVLAAAENEILLESGSSAGTETHRRQFRQVDPALLVRVNTSTSQKVALIRRVCEAIDFDPNEIGIFLKDKKTPGDQPDEPMHESRYASVTALLPLVAEVEGSTIDVGETAELRGNLISVVQPHLPAQPLDVLGGQDLHTFLATHPTETLTPEEVFACFAVFIAESKMLGEGSLHRRILEGQVGDLLRRLSVIA